MPSKDGLRLSTTTPRDGLFFNAFEDAEPTATANSSSMGTPTWRTEVVKAPRKVKPALRRRGSDTTLNSSNQNGRLYDSARLMGHSRSQTEQGGSHHLHPLGSATIGPDTFAGHSGVTRPHLSRLMSAWDSPAGSDVDREGKRSSSDTSSILDHSPAEKTDEKTVLVHEVSSKDSLAGVALKYGITIAELRKANQLWTSDTIHLRKVLYIPLDNLSRTNAVKPPIDLEQLTSISDTYSDKSHISTVRRVPASQLSFFPPPSKPSLDSIAVSDDPFYNQDASTIPSFMRSGSGSGSSSGSPAQPSRTLTSILTAFPIAVSTRHSIISRLSLDSERTSISDEQEHELDEVRTSSTLQPRHLSSPSRGDMVLRTSTSSRSHVISPPSFAPRSISPPTPVNHRKSWTQTDAPEPHAPIRTVQLEPSPTMKLPSLTARPKSRSRALAGIEVDEFGTSR